jgi:hypothetical protein
MHLHGDLLHCHGGAEDLHAHRDRDGTLGPAGKAEEVLIELAIVAAAGGG